MPIPRIAAYPLPEINHPAAVDWQLDPDRAALLIHDMQNYFLAAYAADQDPVSTVVPNIRRLIDAADAAGMPVFYSAQPPRQQTSRRGLLSDFWGDGIQSTEDAAIIPELAPRERHHVVTKWRYSALTRTDLRQSLAFSGRDQLLITGVYGHMGCQVSAVDAFMNDVAPFLIGDAMADFTAEDHRSTLDWVSRRCGRVLSTAEALADLPAPGYARVNG